MKTQNVSFNFIVLSSISHNTNIILYMYSVYHFFNPGTQMVNKGHFNAKVYLGVGL